MFTISVLGPPLVIRDTGVLQFGRKKSLALLIFLALTREWHSRDYLATLFWPQQGQTEARASLRRALSLIHSRAGETLILSEADRVMLSPDVELFVDAEEFRSAAAACMANQKAGVSPTVATGDGKEILELYRGEFLKGFTLPDCSDFTEWQLIQAENLRADAIILFDARIDALRRSGNVAAAIEFARRRLEIDPFDEGAHRRLMRLYADAGEASLALHQFERCTEILRREFDSEPERETVRLADQLRHGRARMVPTHDDGGRSSRWTALPVALAAVIAIGLFASLNVVPQNSRTPQSVAVLLPGENRVDRGSSQYAAGFITLVAGDLSRIDSLRVLRPQPLSQSSEASYVLTGEALTAQGEPAFQLRLLDGHSRRLLWSRIYSSDPAQLLASERETVNSIASALGLKSAELVRASSPASPAGPEAYAAYLEGLYYTHHEITAESIQSAKTQFERAIALDPDFALAISALADSYWGAAQFGVLPPDQAMPRARELAEEAIRLDPNLSAPHVVRAFVLYLFDWDWAGSELEFRTALSINPSSADAYRWYGSLLTTVGRHREAVHMVQQALQLDPASPLNIVNVAARLYYAGRYEAAVQEADHALRLEPQFWMGDLVKGTSLVALGRYAEGIAALARAEENGGGLEPACFRAYALGVSGRRDEARSLIGRIESDREFDFLSPFLLACAYAGLADRERTLGLLEKAAELHDINLVWDIRDPALRFLEGDAGFRALRANMGLDAASEGS